MKEEEVLITIFTPTYNRAHLLSRLFESLMKLNTRDFEWIIVDDGSTDNTEELVKGFLIKATFTILYFKKKNEGKHAAINQGVNHANGELFFIVDSDDFLPKDSLERIQYHYAKSKHNLNLAGVAGKKRVMSNDKLNCCFHHKEFLSSALDFRYLYNYKGDMAEVYKTQVLREYPFPIFDGEKFVTESVVWFRISMKYKIHYFDEFIYDCEYQEGGLTDNYRKLIENNPKGSLLYFKELLNYKIPNSEKNKISKMYYRLARKHNLTYLHIIKEIGVVNILRNFI